MFYFALPEPLSKLLKNAKQNSANTDVEKVSDTHSWCAKVCLQGANIHTQNLIPFQRTSLGATLLSPVSQLALGTIGRSRSLINQSQESLDPSDNYNHSDREEEPHQQDADDEDDSGIVSIHHLTHHWFLSMYFFFCTPNVLIINNLEPGRSKEVTKPRQRQQEEAEPSGICW